LYQIIYEALDQQSRTMLESKCQRDFFSKSANTAWEFLEDVAEKTMQ